MKKHVITCIVSMYIIFLGAPARFGQGGGYVLANKFGCNGHTRLIDCPHTSSIGCTHVHDIGVRCQAILTGKYIIFL